MATPKAQDTGRHDTLRATAPRDFTDDLRERLRGLLREPLAEAAPEREEASVAWRDAAVAWTLEGVPPDDRQAVAVTVPAADPAGTAFASVSARV